jgi:glycosyltransferase involved in cell wall biosynthesis
MPASTRVLVIGHPNGPRTAAHIMAEAARYGVQHRFALHSRASDAEVFDAFRRAKTSLILSRREGSCVAIVESMFSGTPVGILEDAEIGSRVYINAATGRFLAHRNLAAQLTDFIATAHRYRPREWVLDNGVSCFSSTQVLNDRLRRHALENGQEWTLDIAPLQWRPNPTLVDARDGERLRPAYEDIRARFGVGIGDTAGAPGA